jgi:hypothetical protein
MFYFPHKNTRVYTYIRGEPWEVKPQRSLKGHPRQSQKILKEPLRTANQSIPHSPLHSSNIQRDNHLKFSLSRAPTESSYQIIIHKYVFLISIMAQFFCVAVLVFAVLQSALAVPPGNSQPSPMFGIGDSGVVPVVQNPPCDASGFYPTPPSGEHFEHP